MCSCLKVGEGEPSGHVTGSHDLQLAPPPPPPPGSQATGRYWQSEPYRASQAQTYPLRTPGTPTSSMSVFNSLLSL